MTTSYTYTLAGESGEKNLTEVCEDPGFVACSQVKGDSMSQCPCGVTRGGGGALTVIVTLPDGTKRSIFFQEGKPSGTDLTGAGFTYTSETGVFIIETGPERYEIPEEFLERD